MRWPEERSQELLDGLMVLLATAVRVPVRDGGVRVPAVMTEFAEALSADVMSDPGHAGSEAVTLDGVRDSWETANEAGQAVGMTGRQVRRLCSAGLVRHRMTRAGYEVDLADLQRHISSGAA